MVLHIANYTNALAYRYETSFMNFVTKLRFLWHHVLKVLKKVSAQHPLVVTIVMKL